jgi:hypothetical protein
VEIQLKDKIILTDCDGVLLDWAPHFYHWVYEKYGCEVKNPNEYNISASLGINPSVGYAYVREYNSSPHMANIGPLRDAVKYVRKLNIEHGYKFHVISSQTDDESAKEFRKYNLETLFGEGVFDRFSLLGAGDSKVATLSEFRDSNCYWIEDKPKNINTGYNLGLNPIMMAHGHNIDVHADYCNNCNVRVQNWHEIYNIITADNT